MKTAFCSVIFPNNEQFFEDFLNSLENQTDKDFTLLLINDGVKNIENYIKNKSLKFEVIDAKGSIAEIRTFLLNFLKTTSFENIIFGDTDDFFSSNRVQISKKNLETNDVVVCDLNIVNNYGKVIIKDFWKNRPELKSQITINSILDYNFIGLGNTAIKRQIIPDNNIFSEKISAIDWVLFSRILLKNPKVVFTTESHVNYRQHLDNIVGRKELTLRDFKNGFDIKLKHYAFLANESEIFKKLFETYNSKKELVKQLTFLTFELEINNPFWWEEIKIENI